MNLSKHNNHLKAPDFSKDYMINNHYLYLLYMFNIDRYTLKNIMIYKLTYAHTLLYVPIVCYAQTDFRGEYSQIVIATR
jgi:hypothetical protein